LCGERGWSLKKRRRPKLELRRPDTGVASVTLSIGVSRQLVSAASMILRSRQLLFVRRYVALVLDGQPLLPVVVRSDLERNIASRVDANRGFSGWRVERDPYCGSPAVTLPCNEDATVAEFNDRAWRFRRADVNDGNAAWPRCMIRHRVGERRDGQKECAE